MANWRQFCPRPYDASKGIELGALVFLVDSSDKQQLLFLGPDGGSMKLVSGAQLIQVISSEAPLGRAMLGKYEGDEVWIQVAPIRRNLRCCGSINQQESPSQIGMLAQGLAPKPSDCCWPVFALLRTNADVRSRCSTVVDCIETHSLCSSCNQAMGIQKMTLKTQPSAPPLN